MLVATIFFWATLGVGWFVGWTTARRAHSRTTDWRQQFYEQLMAEQQVNDLRAEHQRHIRGMGVAECSIDDL